LLPPLLPPALLPPLLLLLLPLLLGWASDACADSLASSDTRVGVDGLLGSSVAEKINAVQTDRQARQSGQPLAKKP
jgi:hypothetical protein